MTMNPLSALKRNLADRLAKAADRRQHDLALRDKRVAVEHYYAAQSAADRGDTGCIYCS